MFTTVFWATGAFILSALLWQLIIGAVLYGIAGVCWLVVAIVCAPYFIVVGLCRMPRFFTTGSEDRQILGCSLLAMLAGLGYLIFVAYTHFPHTV